MAIDESSVGVSHGPTPDEQMASVKDTVTGKQFQLVHRVGLNGPHATGRVLVAGNADATLAPASRQARLLLYHAKGITAGENHAVWIRFDGADLSIAGNQDTAWILLPGEKEDFPIGYFATNCTLTMRAVGGAANQQDIRYRVVAA